MKKPTRISQTRFLSLQYILLMTLFVAIVSFRSQKLPWPVPDKYVKMKNPVKPDQNAIKTGKELWNRHCQNCHGKTGKGDGSKSGQLKTVPGDMTKTEVQNQPDGALFYKVSEGRKDMPSFKKKIPDQDDIWALVCYMRTLKK
jgi:mono/diheme cytochrome c family protein